MTDEKKTKTLTLKKRVIAPSVADTSSEPRKRSGARARAAALMTREQQKQVADTVTERQAPPSKGSKPARNPVARPIGLERSDHPRYGERTPRGSQTSGTRAERPTPYAATERSRRTDPARTTRPANALFPVFTPCPQGLEEALCAELLALGFEDTRPGRAGCHLITSWTGVLKLNLYSRLATRVLVQVAHAPVDIEDDIFDLAMDTPWEHWFGASHTLRVDTSAVRSPMQSLQYCNLRVKDGICDRLRDREGERPSIDTVRPDARVHLFLDETSATLYLDTSGESLFKRGWRLDKGEAPLRENLAAGLLALSGWDPSQALLDPFCGSGTLLIEAAWIALGVPPGVWRPFAFERLRNHDARLWRDIKEDARSRIATRIDCPLVGVDHDPAVIEAAQRNMERAWLTPDSIRFETNDARAVMPPAERGWLVTNPPYGDRLSDVDPELWPEWASHLKRHYAGWHVNVITSDLELPGKMRLKPKRRFPLHNGALDCRLFSFEMVASSYRDRSSS